MIRAAALGIRLAVLFAAAAPAAGCGGPTQYALQVDSKVAPWKPADPDDLVVEDDADEDDGEDKGDDEE